jgi:hypothetical protein
MTGAHAIGLIVGIAIILILFELLRRRRMRERYAMAWLVIGIGSMLIGVFPGLLGEATRAVGLVLPINLVFFVGLLVLLGVTSQLSYELGLAEDRTRALAEEVALIRLEISEHLATRPEDPVDEIGKVTDIGEIGEVGEAS